LCFFYVFFVFELGAYRTGQTDERTDRLTSNTRNATYVNYRIKTDKLSSKVIISLTNCYAQLYAKLLSRDHLSNIVSERTKMAVTKANWQRLFKT